MERLGCGQCSGVEVLPQAGQGIAKCRDTTFCRNACAAKHHDVACATQLINLEFHHDLLHVVSVASVLLNSVSYREAVTNG